jgi:chitinase
MRMRKAWSLASLIVALSLGVVAAQAQQTYSLVWNANPEPDVVAYKVYVGTGSGQYALSFPTQAPSLDISSSLLSSLPLGSTLYFAVTAVNSAGLESAYSEEVSTAPAATGPTVTSRLSATALVLTVSTLPGATVAFESSTDLTNWSFYVNRTASAQGVATLSQPKSSMLPVRFFRVRAP